MLDPSVQEVTVALCFDVTQPGEGITSLFAGVCQPRGWTEYATWRRGFSMRGAICGALPYWGRPLATTTLLGVARAVGAGMSERMGFA